ncbi:polysaccharide biosynthesis tyrosine autokinase [Chloracidobacterium aggregatum]|uniref:non-specific protein-tyrosine kinase n=1 Tax=Chloracidobacterium sp. N TaxID=2821540 RepID=A0ABX8B583_9BACT|nr:polysaccharide biosynthesis tyrosine autokinase [Chloracidobacterium aggregatum]QUV85017.1 polysaccharide biosynthesis tyrosine autokinase [Chloracidobacterium sp. 2]QUV88580.1 polysaccharide biosynthesis tyrosine autokinase [Chloracidobacterium sp. S]QUV91503.1 polysaccharide biosynthesis tyrosine autokinase [Chloracidobacterium sp. A]QUV94679.1 polysaccharide biosynthesis tyrosine autokinase [Chloracidobacterium sp. N]QUV97882.1 polysaccharide biosynthesis tyrosine autokinase [Chloracidob
MPQDHPNNNVMLAPTATELDLATPTVQDRMRRRGSYQYTLPQEDAGQPIRQAFLTILRYKFTVILCVVLTMTVTGLALSRMQPIYEASSHIEIAPEKEFSSTGRIAFMPYSVDPDYLNTQIRKISSPSLLVEVVKILKLDRDPKFLATGPTTLSAALMDIIRSPRGARTPPPSETKSGELPEASPTPDAGKAEAGNAEDELQRYAPQIGRLASGLQAYGIPRTRLVRITFQHHDPETTKAVVNTVAEVFARRNVSDRLQQGSSQKEFLSSTAARLQQEILEEERKLTEYLRTRKIVSLKPEDNPEVARLTGLNQALLEAEKERLRAEERYQASLSQPVDSLDEMQSDPELQKLRGKISELKQRRLELLGTYTELHPDVVQIDQVLAQAENELKEAKANTLVRIKTAYENAKRREEELRARVEKQRNEVVTQNGDGVMQRMMQDNIDNKKKMLQALQATTKDTEINLRMDLNNITVADRAGTPGAPISPRVSYTLSVAFFLSLFGGVGLAFAREYLNTRIKSVEDVDRLLNLPTLGLIPQVSPKELSKSSGYYSYGGETRALAKLADGRPLPADFNIGLSAFALSASPIGEAYRQLRTSILLSSSEDVRNRIILITSSQPGEGKTTTSFNTAISLAQTGASVLLIDCDLRRPQLQKLFDSYGQERTFQPGLSRYLSGQCKIGEIFTPSPIPYLTLITCGQMPPNPAELLGSQRMRSLLAYAVEKFDYVILDTPPMLSFADATILAAMADSVILVVNCQRSKREIVKRTCRKLDETNTRVLGVVLNGMTQEQSSYYGYDYYGYSSYYRYSQAAGVNGDGKAGGPKPPPSASEVFEQLKVTLDEQGAADNRVPPASNASPAGNSSNNGHKAG